MTKSQTRFLFFIVPLGALFFYIVHNDISIRELIFPVQSIVHLGDIPLNVEIADTQDERMLGLSGRPHMDNIDGLLFIFPEDGYHGIWMKEMHFPIDVIWISSDLEIIGITEGLTPESFPKVFEPPEPVRYIIETDVHFSDTFGIRVGDPVTIPSKFLR